MTAAPSHAPKHHFRRRALLCLGAGLFVGCMLADTGPGSITRIEAWSGRYVVAVSGDSVLSDAILGLNVDGAGPDSVIGTWRRLDEPGDSGSLTGGVFGGWLTLQSTLDDGRVVSYQTNLLLNPTEGTVTVDGRTAGEIGR